MGMRYIILFCAALTALTFLSCTSSQKIALNESVISNLAVQGKERGGIGGSRTTIECYRIVADFNNDGWQDVAISSDLSLFGNAGGNFCLFLGKSDGSLKFVADFFAHPLAMHLRKGKRGEGVLTTYHRSNCCSGSLIQYSVSSDGITKVSQKEIFPGDGGTDEGNAEYSKYFSDGVRVQAQLGVEGEQGRIVWRNY